MPTTAWIDANLRTEDRCKLGLNAVIVVLLYAIVLLTR